MILLATASRSHNVQLMFRTLAALITALMGTAPVLAAQHPIAIDIKSSQTIATFDPQTAFGATIDAHPAGEAAHIFTKQNIEAMRSAGFQPLSYRLMTELAGEAWHWNPEGSWSDPTRQQGYWTSAAKPSTPIQRSYAYRLPRRGNTRDQATQSDYSRIDDGNRDTFWKSNPYLDEHFAGEPHPQWVLVDLGTPHDVDTVRILWGDPYATDFRIQYWRGDDPINVPGDGDWIDFPYGVMTGKDGGSSVVMVASAPLSVRWLRIFMTASSHTTGTPSADVRDSLGYAIRELSIGTTTGGAFHDVIQHGRSQATQTFIWVSSTDPWHRATDRDDSVEQLGFDALYRTGLTNGLGALMPVALLYGIPDDAAAEVSWLKSRGYPVSGIEMGEEPDGQVVSPEDYGALYRQFARSIHSIEPTLRLGGPAFQSTVDYVEFWPMQRSQVAGRGTHENAETSWIGRFVEDLRSHDELDDFGFFSFEWYPFDDLCTSAQNQVESAHAMLRPVLERWRREGVPQSIPWLATEYGYSSFEGQPEVDLDAAIVNLDFVAQFLSLSGTGAYFYGYEPEGLLKNAHCPTWGNLLLFVSDAEHRIRFRVPAYHAARMLTTEWCAKSGKHVMEQVSVEPSTPAITVYALRRPDGSRSLLVINSGTVSTRVAVAIDGRPAQRLHVVQYSPQQYTWRAAGANGHPLKSKPPAQRDYKTAPRDGIRVPARSITVMSGNW